MGNVQGVLRAVALTTLVALLGAGCSMDPASDGAAEPPATELKGSFVGTPGPYVGAVRCPTAVGFFGRAGLKLNAVGLVCEAASYLWQTPQYGGGGGDPFYLTCPVGFIASGISGSAGNHVGSMQLICRSDVGSKYFTRSKGGGSGDSYDIECSDDEKLVGFNLQLGDKYVNGVEIVCGLE